MVYQVTVSTGMPGQREVVYRHRRVTSFRDVKVKTELVPELGQLLTLK
jgi:hypothetical protein